MRKSIYEGIQKRVEKHTYPQNLQVDWDHDLEIVWEKRGQRKNYKYISFNPTYVSCTYLYISTYSTLPLYGIQQMR
jgi:hypothetical protein